MVFGSVATGMKITQGLCLFLSGISFFSLCSKIFKNAKTSLVLAILYMVAPYHLAEIFYRDAFSEIFIPIAVPLIILGLLYLLEKNYKRFLLFFVRWICHCNIFTYCNDYIFYYNYFADVFYSLL